MKKPWQRRRGISERREAHCTCSEYLSQTLTFNSAPSIFFSILHFPPYPDLCTAVPLRPEASQRLNPTFPPRITDKYMKHQHVFMVQMGKPRPVEKMHLAQGLPGHQEPYWIPPLLMYCHHFPGRAMPWWARGPVSRVKSQLQPPKARQPQTMTSLGSVCPAVKWG